MKHFRRITALFLIFCLLLPMTAALAVEGDIPVAEGPAVTEPPMEGPPVTEPPPEEPPATEPPLEEPPATEPPATEPPATEPPVEEPLNEEPPLEEPTTLPAEHDTLPQLIALGGEILYEEDYTLAEDMLIPAGVSLTFTGALYVPAGTRLLVEGALVLTRDSEVCGTLELLPESRVTIAEGAVLRVCAAPPDESGMPLIPGTVINAGALDVYGALEFADGAAFGAGSLPATVYEGAAVNGSMLFVLDGDLTFAAGDSITVNDISELESAINDNPGSDIIIGQSMTTNMDTNKGVVVHNDTRLIIPSGVTLTVKDGNRVCAGGGLLLSPASYSFGTGTIIVETGGAIEFASTRSSQGFNIGEDGLVIVEQGGRVNTNGEHVFVFQGGAMELSGTLKSAGLDIEGGTLTINSGAVLDIPAPTFDSSGWISIHNSISDGGILTGAGATPEIKGWFRVTSEVDTAAALLNAADREWGASYIHVIGSVTLDATQHLYLDKYDTLEVTDSSVTLTLGGGFTCEGTINMMLTPPEDPSAPPNTDGGTLIVSGDSFLRNPTGDAYEGKATILYSTLILNSPLTVSSGSALTLKNSNTTVNANGAIRLENSKVNEHQYPEEYDTGGAVTFKNGAELVVNAGGEYYNFCDSMVFEEGSRLYIGAQGKYVLYGVDPEAAHPLPGGSLSVDYGATAEVLGIFENYGGVVEGLDDIPTGTSVTIQYPPFSGPIPEGEDSTYYPPALAEKILENIEAALAEPSTREIYLPDNGGKIFKFSRKLTLSASPDGARTVYMQKTSFDMVDGVEIHCEGGLEIEPGVKLVVEPGSKLKVDGVFILNGTLENQSQGTVESSVAIQKGENSRFENYGTFTGAGSSKVPEDYAHVTDADGLRAALIRRVPEILFDAGGTDHQLRATPVYVGSVLTKMEIPENVHLEIVSDAPAVLDLDHISGNVLDIGKNGSLTIGQNCTLNTGKVWLIQGSVTLNGGAKLNVREQLHTYTSVDINIGNSDAGAATLDFDGELSCYGDTVIDVYGIFDVAGVNEVQVAKDYDCDITVYEGGEFIDPNGIFAEHTVGDAADIISFKAALAASNISKIHVISSFAINENLTVPAGKTVIVASGSTLTVNAKRTFTVSEGAGLIVADGATLINEGMLTQNGTVAVSGRFDNRGTVNSGANSSFSLKGTGDAFNNAKLTLAGAAIYDGARFYGEGNSQTTLTGRTLLYNGGSIQIDNAALTVANGATLRIEGETQFEPPEPPEPSEPPEPPSPTILNGTLKLISGARFTVAAGAVLENYGLIESDSGVQYDVKGSVFNIDGTNSWTGIDPDLLASFTNTSVAVKNETALMEKLCDSATTEVVLGDSITMTQLLEIPEGKTLTVSAPYMLGTQHSISVLEGGTLRLQGSSGKGDYNKMIARVELQGGCIDNRGTIIADKGEITLKNTRLNNYNATLLHDSYIRSNGGSNALMNFDHASITLNGESNIEIGTVESHSDSTITLKDKSNMKFAGTSSQLNLQGRMELSDNVTLRVVTGATANVQQRGELHIGSGARMEIGLDSAQIASTRLNVYGKLTIGAHGTLNCEYGTMQVYGGGSVSVMGEGAMLIVAKLIMGDDFAGIVPAVLTVGNGARAELLSESGFTWGGTNDCLLIPNTGAAFINFPGFAVCDLIEVQNEAELRAVINNAAYRSGNNMVLVNLIANNRRPVALTADMIIPDWMNLHISAAKDAGKTPAIYPTTLSVPAGKTLENRGYIYIERSEGVNSVLTFAGTLQNDGNIIISGDLLRTGKGVYTGSGMLRAADGSANVSPDLPVNRYSAPVQAVTITTPGNIRILPGNYGSDSVKVSFPFTAVVTPEDAKDKTVSWEAYEADEHSQTIPILNGSLDNVALNETEYEVKASSGSGSGGAVVESEPIKFLGVDLHASGAISWLNIPEDRSYSDRYAPISLTGGQKLAFRAKVLQNEDSTLNAAYGNADITWTYSIAEPDAAAYASIDPKTGVLTTKAVVTEVFFHVVAKPDLPGGGMISSNVIEAYSPSRGVRIFPSITAVQIAAKEGSGGSTEYITGKTKTLNLNDAGYADPLNPTNKLSLWPHLIPYAASESIKDVVWTQSDKGALVTLVPTPGAAEPGRVNIIPTQNGVNAAMQKPQVITLTCTVTDGNGAKKNATVKVQLAYFATGVDITYKDGSPIPGSPIHVAAGSFVELKGVVSGAVVNDRNVVWSLDEGETVFASVNAAGRVTTKATVLSETKIRVTATAKDGSGESDNVDITIQPRATGVQIVDGNGDLRMPGETVYLYAPRDDPRVYDSYEQLFLGYTLPGTAEQSLEWSIAPKTIADLDGAHDHDNDPSTPAGAKITPKYNAAGKLITGTVTLTAKAKDGSGKSASIKVKIGTFASAVKIENLTSLAVGEKYKPGDKIKLKATAWAQAPSGGDPGVPPDNGSVVWRFKNLEDAAYLTLTPGANNTATVTVKSPLYREISEATIIAAAKETDDPDAFDSIKLSAAPVEDVLIIQEDIGTSSPDWDNITGETKTLGLTGQITLRMGNFSNGNAVDPSAYTLTWAPAKSSAIADITVNADNSITLTGKKAGTVKLTATAVNNANKSKRTAPVTVVFADRVTSIVVAPATNVPVLASGKTLQYNATLVYESGARKVNNSAVDWNVTSPGAASITAAGRLTALPVKGPVNNVFVVAELKSNSRIGDACAVPLIVPLATGVSITQSILGNIYNRTGQTVELDRMFHSGGIQLDAQVEPKTITGVTGDAAYQAVSWTSSNPKIATVSSTGLVQAVPGGKGGTVTITVKTQDGSNKSASVKVTVMEEVQHLRIAYDDPNAYGRAVVTAGKTLKLTPKFDDPSDPSTVYSPTNTKLRWWIEEVVGTDAPPVVSYASISSAGVLSARMVQTPVYVVVYCEALDGSGVLAWEDVLIVPPVLAINLTYQTNTGDTAAANNKTVPLDKVLYPSCELFVNLNPMTVSAAGFMDDLDASKFIAVTSSNPNVVSVGEVVRTVPHGIEYKCPVTAVGAGKATVTFAAKDGSGKKATVNFNVASMVEQVQITAPDGAVSTANRANVSPPPMQKMGIAAGKSIQLKAAAVYSAGAGSYLPASNNKVTWSVTQGAQYASVTAAGMVKAKAGCEWQPVVIRATAADGSGVYNEVQLWIKPAAASVQIWDDGSPDQKEVTNKTLTVNPGSAHTFFALLPPGGNADYHDTVWTVSAKTVTLEPVSPEGMQGECKVTVDANAKPGSTVTLTAAAADGSGKKATVKLYIGWLTDTNGLRIYGPNGEPNMYLAAGKSALLKLKQESTNPQFEPTNKKVLWSVASGAAYGTVSTAGNVTVKAGTAVGSEIVVRADALDGSGAYHTFTVKVMTPVTKMIMQNNRQEDVTKTTIGMEQGTDTLRFQIKYQPGTTGHHARFAWTANHKDLDIRVDYPIAGSLASNVTEGDGYVSVKMKYGGNFKVGTKVVLTARATDGSNQTATVTLQCTKLNAQP